MSALPPESPFSLHPKFFELLSQDLDTIQLSHLPFLSTVHPLIIIRIIIIIIIIIIIKGG